ncbi:MULTISPECIES: NTP transferase domain-containing protein [unclassified Actinomyces]|uniref:bifunctional UDP-N-acetylglucosamine diphosphorylase/glucosamine-1-phosphate N-acetyltransferase GlmU n=1 Tax=unclassified Actinomyces TaxID=2609248 RepID=UPI0020179028|nr:MULTISPECIES: NTP transferase domain-containing protein [unclassified Actinomyces]MCL3776822.1 NTP transferase domain-containing protein [Actinomyces sp. AC-20-1]MCL3789731.1 NTP transferase domain-containing protein [Actinomyces sp. 187325]MCL3792088.1 NTP transferase domain-containing protein [Actinomyces sp. 186855]MCL3794733.1 NTP transferase domain-containing protein [Actinomyces sp. 217892]
MAPTTPSAVIVMAAGKGTRMRSATPKVLHRIGGRSLLDHAVSAARALAPEHLVVVVRHERDAVVAHLAEVAPDALPADQDEVPGTGRAVACGLAALPDGLTGSVVVTSGDVPLLDTATLEALVAQHAERGDAVTLLTTELADPTGYGRVLRERAEGPGADPLSVVAVVEQRDATEAQRAVREVNAGVYVFDIALLRRALDTLGTDNDQGEVYLTDVVARAHAQGLSTSALLVGDHWLVEGCNDRAQLAALGAELNRRVLARWMEEGVGVTDPATTWVDVDVELARDVTLEPGVVLHGRTRVGEGARVGAHSVLSDVEVPAGAVVTPLTQLDGSPRQDR